MKLIMTLVYHLGKQIVQLRIELKIPFLKILEYAYLVSPQEKIVEIRRDESQLLRDAKTQKLGLISKLLAGIRYKCVIVGGIKYNIAYSEWIKAF